MIDKDAIFYPPELLKVADIDYTFTKNIEFIYSANLVGI